MNNKKTYTLKKEILTPNTYIVSGTPFSQSVVDGAYISACGRWQYSLHIVEKNPEWFVLKEEDKNQNVKSLVFFGKTFESNTNDYILSITGDELLTEKIDVIKEVINNVLKEEVPSQQKEFTEPRGNNFGFNKGYKIMECYYIDVSITHEYIQEKNIQGNKSCKEQGCKIYSVRRNSDNTIWTLGDMVNIVGGILGWQIVSLTESCGVVYADLKLYGNKFSSKQVVLQELKKYK